MRRAVVIFLLVVVAVGAWLWTALQPPSPLRPTAVEFTLSGVTVIEPTQSRAEARRVTVRDGKIAAIDAAASATGGGKVLDYPGRYVLPGLIDMHAHEPPANVLALSGYVAFLYLAHGVTSIRDAGDTDGTAVPATKKGIDSGAFPGPRIFSCGPFVSGAEPVRWVNSPILRTAAGAEALTARVALAGNVCIKSYEDLSAELIAALKAAAARHGLHVMGHVPAKLSYEEALVPDVQHFFGVPPPSSLDRDHVLDRTADWEAVDDARLDFIVETTLKHGIINTPTLVSTHQLLQYRDYESARTSKAALLVPRLYPDVAWNPTEGMPVWRGIENYLDRIEAAWIKKKDLVGRLYRAGARLRLGTDAQQPFVAPGLGMHQEMREFAGAGVPIEEIWAMATWKAGEVFPVAKLGRIEAGAPADLLVFRDDPSSDLNHLDSLEAVIAQGKLYTRADIDAALKEYQSHFRGTPVDPISVAVARRVLARTVLRDY